MSGLIVVPEELIIRIIIKKHFVIEIVLIEETIEQFCFSFSSQLLYLSLCLLPALRYLQGRCISCVRELVCPIRPEHGCILPQAWARRDDLITRTH